MLNLATLLEESARTWPERPAVIQDDNPLSYRALNEMANRVANLLAARGVRPGERVALACPAGVSGYLLRHSQKRRGGGAAEYSA